MSAPLRLRRAALRACQSITQAGRSAAAALLLAAIPCALALPGSATAAGFTEQGTTILGGFGMNARSASFADIDNDGDVDLVIIGGYTTSGRVQGRQLFLNNTIGTGEKTFTRVATRIPTDPALADTDSWSSAWGDYDADGFVDLFVGSTNSSSTARGDLFRNQGDGTFVNVTASTANDPGFHQSVAFLDANNDGKLDLFLAMEGPEGHEIYLQNPIGKFTAVGQAAGLWVTYEPSGSPIRLGKAYGLAIGDYDADGDMDAFISTCRVGEDIRDTFFRNDLDATGTLRFTDITDTNGTQDLRNSYGTEFIDFDDDGDLDLYNTGADGEPTKLFRNNGDGSFTDVDTLNGHPLLSWPGTDTNGSQAVDYDNDGRLDLFFHDHLNPTSANTTDTARTLYRNEGNWKFRNVTAEVGLLEKSIGSYDSAWADFDLDGDMDLCATTDSRARERFYVSDFNTNGNHWLMVRLLGYKGSATPIGAEVYATIHKNTPQERRLRRDWNTSAIAFHQSQIPIHFGLAQANIIDELLIVWPNKRTTLLRNLTVDRYLDVHYSENGSFWSAN